MGLIESIDREKTNPVINISLFDKELCPYVIWRPGYKILFGLLQTEPGYYTRDGGYLHKCNIVNDMIQYECGNKIFQLIPHDNKAYYRPYIRTVRLNGKIKCIQFSNIELATSEFSKMKANFNE